MFQPSPHSFPGAATVITTGDDYGALINLTKRERRDVQIRRAERDEDRAKKALAKGKKEKAEKYFAKAAKHWAKAEELAGKVEAKGKTSTFTTEEAAKRKINFRKGKATGLGKALRGASSNAAIQQIGAEIEGETTDFETSSASGVGTALKVGGLAALGGGLYYYFTMR
jgi:hypothetical protein